MRQTILANLPAGYEEAMNWGMITYQVPLERYPSTYNGQPLAYAATNAIFLGDRIAPQPTTIQNGTIVVN